MGRQLTSVSAMRSDGVKYLFEKEGIITIPETEITWWNANHGRLYKRTLKAETFNVLTNPDLGMLSTIRDSLNAENVLLVDSKSAEDNLFLGLSKKQLAALTILLLLMLLLRKK